MMGYIIIGAIALIAIIIFVSYINISIHSTYL